MNGILLLPIGVRLAAVFVLGACIGSAVNWAIYALAWNPRPISPWSWPAFSAPRRRWWDRLPIVGWLGLRREAGLHGAGFWVRPLLLELVAALGYVALYWWETVAGGLLPWGVAEAMGDRLQPTLHLEFVSHGVLIALMLAASMIDADEKIIPDEITVAGTLSALVLAAAWPWSLLPVATVQGLLDIEVEFLRLTSPNAWPAWLEGSPQKGSLWLGLLCWWGWCAALLPRTWYSRHGWRRAVGLAWSRLVREPSTYRILRMTLLGTLAVVLVWFRADAGWHGLLTALVGAAAGGGLVWLVRIIGSVALQREAMGFGDVTLMAMIGAFLGWQPCLVVFFLAPAAGLLIGVARLILFRDREIPYGPFLCLAALGVVVFWNSVWASTRDVFALGWWVPLLMLGCLALMAVMLGMWRLILGLFR